ncbi:MAG: hypothetical protein ACFBSE_19110 [Prochloraceae cyanobacterium]
MKVTAIALITLSVSLTTITPILASESSDECHMIMPSGEKMNLSGLCNSPSPENPNLKPENNNNNNLNTSNERVVYGESEPTAIEALPKLNSRAAKRRRQRELERKRLFQEYSHYKQYIRYHHENSEK